MSTTTQPVPVEVTLRGNVGEFAGEYARDKVASALAVAHGRVIAARVVLDYRHDPAVERPALAEASADVDGRLIRAKTSAASMPEAVDDLQDRLRRQLVQLQDRTRTRYRWTGLGSEGQWRHGSLPRRPLSYFPRPDEAREVVRHKTFASEPMTIDEAAYEMDLLDHDFFLYRDADSDAPALVHRLADGRYGVQGVEPDGTVATVVYEAPPPSLTDADARSRLEVHDEPFVFYLDSRTGEGRVLYHRYDGHYGLVELVA